MYYASLIWQWHPVMILVRTNHLCLRVGCHNWHDDLLLMANKTPPARDLRPHGSDGFRLVRPSRLSLGDPRRPLLPTKHDRTSFLVCGGVIDSESWLAGAAWGSLREETEARPQQKALDDFDADFARDARNVRIGLVTDGFSPYNTSAASYSCWPIFVIPYNFPHSLCMKYEHMFLCFIIPSPDHPRTCLNTMLKPLIEKLK
jgi:hypothetical protein